jgi:hypothetical protein
MYVIYCSKCEQDAHVPPGLTGRPLELFDGNDGWRVVEGRVICPACTRALVLAES